MIEPTKDGPVEGFSFDPTDPEDCNTTLGEVVNFMNAERAAQGRPKARSIIIVALDKPYSEIGEDTYEPA